MELSRLKQLVAEQFRDQKGVVAVLLYGSYAKGLARADSDADVAVLYEHEYAPDSLKLWNLKETLEQVLGIDVDLVCLNRADPIIGNQIYKNHAIVLVNDARKLIEYWAQLSSEYAELKEFIRPMEEQILERRYCDRPRNH